MSFQDAFLLGDALIRISLFWVYRKQFQKARYFVNEAFTIFSCLVKSDPSILTNHVYSFMIWNRISIQVDTETLRHAHNWYVENKINMSKILSRILVNSVFAISFPEHDISMGDTTPRPHLAFMIRMNYYTFVMSLTMS